MKSFFQGLFKNTTQYIGSGKSDNIQRILLKGNQKTQVIHKIEQIVFQAKFSPVPIQLEDICEKVHYQVMNDEPVRVDHLQKLLPNINFNTYNEDQYNEWLRYKHNLDSEKSEIVIDNQKSVEGENKVNNMAKQDKVFDQQDILNQYKNRRK